MSAWLVTLLQQLRAILVSIPSLEHQAYRPPIIEGDAPRRQADAIPGLRIYKDAVKREAEVLEQFLANNDHDSDFSTNAAYFIAVWNEILSAPPPIVAIGKIFDPPRGKVKQSASGGTKPGGIKVDVVADEGRAWIRVNTVKNSRLLAEFREFDSYLTGSEDEDSDHEEHFDPPTAQDNSLVRMGRALVAASMVPVPGTNERPCITLRLTRLDPAPGVDERIMQTVDSLRKMGIGVELGPRLFQTLDPPASSSDSTSSFPTSRINLDLSMLIAVVSDLSHAELPKTEKEAWSRFCIPAGARSWKLGKMKNGNASDGDLSKHSRALSTQCIQEMEHGILDEMVERLHAVSLLDEAEFWTTQEARERCLQIVGKIGGPREKRRASALFDDAPDLREKFWRDSRYPPSHFPSFLPIRIHPTSRLSITSTPHTSPFWGHLIQTCQNILSHDVETHPKQYRKDGEMERAKVTKANTKLTVHTVDSMLVGASLGMTTLTANKASVKAMLREMKAVKQEYTDENRDRMLPKQPTDRDTRPDEPLTAAIWIVEPRSLAESSYHDILSEWLKLGLSKSICLGRR